MDEGQAEAFEQPEEGFDDGMDDEEGFQGDPAQYGEEEAMDDEEDDDDMQQQMLMQQQLQYQRQQEEAYHMHQQQQLHHQQHYEQYQGEDGLSPGGEEEGYA